MIKKILFLVAITAIFITANKTSINNANHSSAATTFKDVGDEYAWAHDAISTLCSKGVISGIGDNMFSPQSQVTKEQMATMIAKAYNMENSSNSQTYIDVLPERWSFSYVEGTKDIIVRTDDLEINQYAPERPQTRAEVASSCVKALLANNQVSQSSSDILSASFIDYSEIPPAFEQYLAIATEKGIVVGDNGYLRPNDYVTRAQAAVMVYRTLNIKPKTQTPIVDAPHISAEDAMKWAQKRGAHQRFIDVAPLYWKYGELTGINPEIMYGQAAKETNFGKYTGNVKPEQNNWAGIKIYAPSGDEAEDHETFPTADDGVRAHFNHMCAYVGAEPIGTPHDRYNIVSRLSWAGTIKYAEELSTKWAPSEDYGSSLVENYVNDMRK